MTQKIRKVESHSLSETSLEISLKDNVHIHKYVGHPRLRISVELIFIGRHILNISNLTIGIPVETM